MEGDLSVWLVRGILSILDRSCFKFRRSAGYEGFDKLMAFIEKVTGEEFLVFLQSVMQNVIIEIIGQAGASSKWAADCSVPDSVFERAQSMLRGLGKIQGQSEDAADFLAGALPCQSSGGVSGLTSPLGWPVLTRRVILCSE